MPRSNSKGRAQINGRKLELIMRAARRLFLEHGYSDTSMDAIAEESGVSKATVYAYFHDKKQLFAAIVSDFAQRYAVTVMTEQRDVAGDLPSKLLRLGRSVLDILLAADTVAAHRMVIAEAARAPELGRLYYQSGPLQLLGRIESALKSAVGNGQLQVSDTRRAAEQFIDLVRGNLQLRALVCVGQVISEREKRAVIASGVEVFCRAYVVTSG